MTEVTVNDDNRIVVEAHADVEINGQDLERGGRYAVDPDIEGVDEAIMAGKISKLRKKKEGEL